MLLHDLMKSIPYTEIINRSGIDPANTEVSALCLDSRKVIPGSIFVCISGSLTDGHDYAWAAFNRQCRIFVVEHPTKLPDEAFVIVTKNSRIALARLSAAFFGNPADEMTIIGVTGTKGKTTSSLMICQALNDCGIPTGYIGSNGITFQNQFFATVNTTPESYDLHFYMRKMLDAGVKTLVMEVSSQALKMARVHGIRFHTCVFTNLSPDHIGEYEHPDFNDYKYCKQSLFSDYGAEHIVFNADDEYAEEIIHGNRCLRTSVALHTPSDIHAKDLSYFRHPGELGVQFTCEIEDEVFPVSVSFPGEFSVYNAMTAIAVCRRLGIPPKKVAASLKKIRVKGRFETYELPSGAIAVIDYAHNGVSLKAALQALRTYEPNRLICLFGSVGGRTRIRRAELGLVASRDADFCILTSDNPDNEAPSAIISEIAAYFTTGTCPYMAIPDRKKAIEYALAHAEKNDIVLLAGKGHEDYQMVCGIREDFSEAAIIREFCESAKMTT
ncbi:MAG: UDP-N-acetylmuramoyl-L-alanyl-D-glutamate--2,6-diaminopimelate ligase [Clostridia bacterium]|nr:UDP-N-acetylmuramoyl-L-alanyl-D-glutamate--2,6-diaminopimelate ligase [Clostridia bacterium]